MLNLKGKIIYFIYSLLIMALHRYGFFYYLLFYLKRPRNLHPPFLGLTWTYFRLGRRAGPKSMEIQMNKYLCYSKTQLLVVDQGCQAHWRSIGPP